MRTSRLGKVAQKYQSLREMAQSRVDDAHRALLTNVVETYLILNADESAQFEHLITLPGGEEVVEMISVYEQRGIQKGMVKGIEKGMEKGIAHGTRQTLLRQMAVKFGELPISVREHIESRADTTELNRLTDLVVSASSLDEMSLKLS